MQEFIKIAEKGGYPKVPFYGEEYIQNLNEKSVLLDPLAWAAVGKAKGWPEKPLGEMSTWVWYMHRFLDLLIEGKDINSALALILK